jgi:hypothetical protein
VCAYYTYEIDGLGAVSGGYNCRNASLFIKRDSVGRDIQGVRYGLTRICMRARAVCVRTIPMKLMGSGLCLVGITVGTPVCSLNGIQWGGTYRVLTRAESKLACMYISVKMGGR